MPTADAPSKAPPTPANRSLWILLAVVLLAFAISRLWLLFILEPGPSDLTLYAGMARHGVDQRQVVYRDFPCEYPPLAWWLMTLPRLAGFELDAQFDNDPANAKRAEMSYRHGFQLFLFPIDVVCLATIYLIGRRISPLAAWGLPAAYVLLTTALPHLVYDRLDLGLLMFFLLWAYCWRRSLESSARTDAWSYASYLFLGLGFSFKVFPIVCFPLVLLADAQALPVRRVATRALVFSVGALAPFVIQFATSNWSVLMPFDYHGDRGIHLESIWASMILAVTHVGVPAHVASGYGAVNLAGPWHDALKEVARAAIIVSAGLLGLWAVLRGRGFDRRTALDAAYLAMINSTVLFYVYSPQYLIWLMPLALLLASDVFPARPSLWCLLLGQIAVITAISTWLFPGHYNELVSLEPLEVGVSIARSVCLVALALLLNYAFFTRYGSWPLRPMRGQRDRSETAVTSSA